MSDYNPAWDNDLDLLQEIERFGFDGVWLTKAVSPGEKPVITDDPFVSAMHPTKIAYIDEPVELQAKRFHVRPDRYRRWLRIKYLYLPGGLTQSDIADVEIVGVDAIEADFNKMRKCGLLPEWKKCST